MVSYKEARKLRLDTSKIIPAYDVRLYDNEQIIEQIKWRYIAMEHYIWELKLLTENLLTNLSPFEKGE